MSASPVKSGPECHQPGHKSVHATTGHRLSSFGDGASQELACELSSSLPPHREHLSSLRFVRLVGTLALKFVPGLRGSDSLTCWVVWRQLDDGDRLACLRLLGGGPGCRGFEWLEAAELRPGFDPVFQIADTLRLDGKVLGGLVGNKGVPLLCQSGGNRPVKSVARKSSRSLAKGSSAASMRRSTSSSNARRLSRICLVKSIS